MNRPRHQFFSGAAFAGNQHAARLRRNRLDQLENFAHLRAGADDVIQPGEPAKFAAQDPGFFFQLDAFRNLRHRLAQLID